MINLLPTTTKENLGFGRRNTRLRHWAFALLIGMVGCWTVILFGLFFINQSTASYASQIAKTEIDLNNQKLPETEKRVEEISASLKLAVSVLSRQILFSKLFKQVGAAIPAKASLTGLSVTKITGGIDLSAVAADYETATQVQVNLQDPANKIFDKADIVSITCANTSTVDPKYPCSVVIRAQFAKNNPFLFISGPKTGSAKP